MYAVSHGLKHISSCLQAILLTPVKLFVVVCYDFVLFLRTFVAPRPIVVLLCLFGFGIRLILTSYYRNAPSFISFQNNLSELILIWSGVVVYAFNLNTWEAEAGGTLEFKTSLVTQG